MLKIGIRAHDVDNNTADILAKKVKDLGFDYVQLVLHKALISDNGLLDSVKAEEIHKAFNRNGVKIAMLGAYFNPLHHNEEIVTQGVKKFKNHLTYAQQLDTLYVGSETGSYNDDKWTYNPLNHSSIAYQKILKVFKNLSEFSKSTKSIVAIEGAYAHGISTPKILKKLIDDLNSEHVRVIIDLYNYLNIDNYQQADQIFMEAIELLHDKIVIFHLKDFIIENNTLKQVGLGKGLMNYPFIIKQIEKYCNNAYLIFEGIVGEEIKESLKFIKNIINNVSEV